jgi:diguanylate cyclase
MEETKDGDGRWRWLAGERKRTKEEVILMLLCGLTIVSILPFGIFRLTQGNLLAAAVDMALVVAMLAVIVHVWRTGRHKVASLGVTLFYSAGMLMVVHLHGVSLVYWVYPTIDRRLLHTAADSRADHQQRFAGGAGGDPADATGAASTC